MKERNLTLRIRKREGGGNQQGDTTKSQADREKTSRRFTWPEDSVLNGSMLRRLETSNSSVVRRKGKDACRVGAEKGMNGQTGRKPRGEDQGMGMGRAERASTFPNLYAKGLQRGRGAEHARCLQFGNATEAGEKKRIDESVDTT